MVVNRAALKSLPGVSMVPLTGDRAFPVLEPGQGVPDLELAVVDRLEDPSVESRERQALVELRSQLSRRGRERRLDGRGGR
jgi:hypothetical protein